MKKTVLLTGFEPFNGATVNPAWEAVRALKGWSGDDFLIEVLQLYVPGRSSEWGDLLADAIGVGAGAVIAMLLLRLLIGLPRRAR